MPKIKINVSEERRTRMMSKDFTFEVFMNTARQNGWTEPEDKPLLESIFKQFRSYRRKFNNGQTKSTEDNSMSMLSHIMDTKLSEDTPNTAKSDMLSDFRTSRYCSYASNLDDSFIKYMLESDNAVKCRHEEFGEKKQKFITDTFEENKSPLLREEGDMELMELCYDSIFDKNGKYDGDLESVLGRITHSCYGDNRYTDRKQYFTDIYDTISKIPEENRSDAQKQALEKLDYQIKTGIDYTEERDKWTDMAYKKGYMYSPRAILRAFHEAGKDLPEDHPYKNILKELEEGKVKEYPGVNSLECPFIVMNTIIAHAKAELDKMPDTPEKKNLLSEIEDYTSPSFKKRVEEELNVLPAIEKMKSFQSPESKKAVKALCKTLQNSQNNTGNGMTTEFTEMISSMKEFINADFSAPLGSIAGSEANRTITNMEDRIIGYAISEKNNPFNELVPLSMEALKCVNKDKATVLKAEICKNILTELDSKKKKWYDSKDTPEYTAFRNAVKTLSEIEDENSEEYKQAVDDLRKFSKEYIDAKTLTKTAIQEAGEIRKKMAVLAYSLTNPEEARQMVDEANEARKAQNKINLKDLEKKADAGNKLSDEAVKNAEEAKEYVRKRQAERKAINKKEWQTRMDNMGKTIEEDKVHKSKVFAKFDAKQDAREKHIRNIKNEADKIHNPKAVKNDQPKL